MDDCEREECLYCDETFANDHALRQHIFACHMASRLGRYYCPACDEEINGYYGWNIHLKSTDGTFLLHAFLRTKEKSR
jgi:hypothetical protein